ncbi:MAG: DUF3365 domain-containing protein [Candidatus Scalindua sp. AMX11]|nr:MAG: DUF3365 domain-containing protein [Candidatus Scalindua sp.]NOG84733.1 DUF3365 domain-containing protein [Planctomycetota bacterium]RZV98339.1 MAG: DUF3365 domain-containing protein [Candidatus Scalindua sp. SCAELEC01]TDE66568.1 MAG: DUF3365 domain-containing protein [Candidatus Scalindua sp. AMX11]GJQ58937.1 MAG: hypothetical protein SCALA701_17380 [Candidatus Scalindua sp.]
MIKTGKILILVAVMIYFFTDTPVTANETVKKRMFVSPQDIGIEKAVERAKKTVRMIDDMYKTFIVLVTKEYVTDPTMFSALILSKKVFEAMSKKGWHEARLLGTDETPHNPDNLPKDIFERGAVEALLSGQNYYEKVEKVGNKYYLRSATSVIAVMQGCTICHPGKKVGDLLGAISYRISVEEYFD